LASDQGLAVEVRPPSIELGQRPLGSAVTVAFEVANRGTTAVRVAGVRTSCTCQKTTLASHVLPAGGVVAGTVEVVGPTRAGDYRGYVALVLGDGSSPGSDLPSLAIRGTFVSAKDQLGASVDSIHMGNVRPEDQQALCIAVRRYGDPPIGEVRPMASKEWIAVSELPNRGNDKVAVFKVAITAPAAVGAVNEHILFQGRNADDFLRVPITGEVFAPFELSPQPLLVPSAAPRCSLQVKRNYGPQPTLVSWTFVSGTGLECLSVTEQPGCSSLDVTFRRTGAPDALLRGELHLLFQGRPAPEPVAIPCISLPHLTR
jgi:hypothetical protein